MLIKHGALNAAPGLTEPDQPNWPLHRARPLGVQAADPCLVNRATTLTFVWLATMPS
jgi:hypothetical protein